MATTDELTRLTTFQHHIDDMRNLVMCKICLKPLYEPFILACGHTYCYGCLRSWFSGLDSRRRTKNCPDCRAEVESAPSPNYILRDLVHMFINRAELLPEDETVDEHMAGRIAEADLLSSDKDTKGLFKGIFKHKRHPLARYGPLHDPSDNVLRCPDCHHELEDGMCNQCGYETDSDHFPFFSDGENLDEGSMTIDGDSTDSDDQSNVTGYDSDPELAHAFHGPRLLSLNQGFGTDVYSELDYGTPDPYGPDEDDDDDGDDDDDDEDDMHSFIDDQEHDEPDEVDEDGFRFPPSRPVARPRMRQYQIPDDDDEDSEDENDNHAESEPYNWHPGGPIEVDSLSDYDGSDASQDEGQDQQTNYDESDEESRRSVTPIAIPIVPRRRPVIISDDEEDNDEDVEVAPRRTLQQIVDDMVESEGSSSASNDTATPPQPLVSRQQRLDNHRKRRQTPETWRSIARGRFEATSTRQDPRRQHTALRESRSRAALGERTFS